MASPQGLDQLKARLLRDIDYLCRRSDVRWNSGIVTTLRELRDGTEAVFFGGTLRSLMLSRVFGGRFGRPRDVDVVVAGKDLSALRSLFGEAVKRETRFGGLHVERQSWQFDIWPLERTWAFVQNQSKPDFAALPSTTFFNLEAIAVDVWPRRGSGRTVYSGDDQFFKGILSQTLEVNNAENPYPPLCVVRSLVFASTIPFKIGPRLANYLVEHGQHMSIESLEEAQLKHYGLVRVSGATMREQLERIANDHRRNPNAALPLLVREQLSWWFEQAMYRANRRRSTSIEK